MNDRTRRPKPRIPKFNLVRWFELLENYSQWNTNRSSWLIYFKYVQTFDLSVLFCFPWQILASIPVSMGSMADFGFTWFHSWLDVSSVGFDGWGQFYPQPQRWTEILGRIFDAFKRPLRKSSWRFPTRCYRQEDAHLSSRTTLRYR